jgi:tape measure domain-containing protein
VSDLSSAFKILIQAHPGDAVAAFREVDAAASQSAKGLESSFKASGDAAHRSRQSTESWATTANQAFQLVTGVAGLAKSAFMAVAGAASSIAGEFASTGNTFEQLGIRFETVFGGSGPAKKALDWATEFGAKTPLTLEEVTSQMIKMKTFGFDPMDGSMQKIGDASFALGTDFNGIVTALGQMSLKGKVSSEELMQLAERNVPAFEILREKFHLTAGQMEKIGDAGLDVKEAVKAIVDEMGVRYQGAMQRASDTTKGALSTIGDTWEVLKKTILDSGPWEFVRESVVAIRDKFSEFANDPVVIDYIKDLGAKVYEWMQVAVKVVGIVYDRFGSKFKSVWTYIADFFAGTSTSAKEWAGYLIDKVFGIAKGAINAYNLVLGMLEKADINGWLSRIVEYFFKATAVIVRAVGDAVKGFVDIVGNGVAGVLEYLRDISEKYPKIAEYIGLSPAALKSMRDGVDQVRTVAKSGISAVQEGIATTSDSWGAMFSKSNGGFASMKISLDSINKEHAEWKKSIDDIVVVLPKIGELTTNNGKAAKESVNEWVTISKEGLQRQKEDAIAAYRKIEDARLRAFGLEQEAEMTKFRRAQEDLEDSFKRGMEASRSGKDRKLFTSFWTGTADELKAFEEGFDAVSRKLFSGDQTARYFNIGSKAYFAEEEKRAETAFKRRQEDALKAFKQQQDEAERKEKEAAEKRIKEHKWRVEDDYAEALKFHADALNDYLKVAGKPLDVNIKGDDDEIIDPIINRIKKRAAAEGTEAYAVS